MTVTARDVDRLIEYLPLVRTAGIDACPLRDPLANRGLFSVDYPPEYEQLLAEISGEPWEHTRYRVLGGDRYDDPEAIATADLDELRAMLTFIARGERFSAGFFGRAVRTGALGRILERLAQLQQGLAD